MDWLKNNWKSISWILIAIAALILLYILFWPSKTPTSHDQEKKTIDSLIIVITTLKTQSHERIQKDSILAETAKKKADYINTEKLVYQAQAKTYEARSKYYALLYQAERDKGDSGAAFSACDQIIQMVDSQAMVINTLNALGDSLEVQRFIQLSAKDSIILTQTALLASTEDGLQKTNKAYQGLEKDYRQQVKANKTNRTLSRILAATTLILGAILIAK